MTKLDSNNQHRVHLDLGLELVFEDQSRMQANKTAVEADERKNRESIALGYRLVGVNVLQESYRAEVAPLVRPARWASVTCLPFEDFAESFEISSSHT
jgi:hypothetical protein